MPVATRKQIRDSVLNSTQQNQAQVGSLIEDFINVTLQEIGSPSWAFRNERHHVWSWLKRKTTFTATSEDTVLERDIDKIALLRQTSTPAILTYVPDDIFYRELPNPTDTGNPRYYRLWEIQGTSAKLSAARTLSVVSSSALDTSVYNIAIQGYVSGKLISEIITLNGTASVASTNTFDARELFVSKSANTNGNLTISDSSSNTLVVIGPQEISPRFKVVSLFPIPTSITIYCEYYKRIKELSNDSEMPEFDPKWHHVVRIGTIAKTFQYLGKTEDSFSAYNMYAGLVRAMVADDTTNPDVINYLNNRDITTRARVRLHFSEDVIS